MKVVALLAIRNEEKYLEVCLENLHLQGFEVVLIDNDSTDKSKEIIQKYQNKNYISEVFRFPYEGIYEWQKILKLKEDLALKIDADWFMHCDADEIRLPHKPFKTIKEAVESIDALGYNAINFNEFVFIPQNDESYEGKDYSTEMKYYYFFNPSPLHRLNLWKKQKKSIDLSSSGGHQVNFDGIRVYPDPFILEHYIYLSNDHAKKKYQNRKFNEYETKKLGWHGFRASFKNDLFKPPPLSSLSKKINEYEYDTSKPTSVHLFYREDEIKNDSSQSIIKGNNAKINNSKKNRHYFLNGYLREIKHLGSVLFFKSSERIRKK